LIWHTPRRKRTWILLASLLWISGSTSPLELDSWRNPTQRWFSPQTFATLQKPVLLCPTIQFKTSKIRFFGLSYATYRVIRNETLIEKDIWRFLLIVFDLERTNQSNLLPDKDLVDLCHPIEPYQVTKNLKYLVSLVLDAENFYL